MINFSYIPFEVYFYLLSLLVVFQLSGSAILFLCRIKIAEDSFLRVFTAQFVGLLFVVMLYAAYVTSGVTIQFGFLAVGLLSWWSCRKLNCLVDKRPSFKHYFCFDQSGLKGLGVLSGFLLLFYLLLGSLYYNEPYNNLPLVDMYFYSTIIEGYHLHGIETRHTVIDVLNPEIYRPSIYHHSELWLAAFIYKTFDLYTFEGLAVGARATLLAMLSVGMIALSRVLTNSLMLQIISPLFVFAAGIVIIEPFPQINTFVSTIGYAPKIMLGGLIFLMFTILLFKKHPLFHLPLLLIPIINVTMVPGAFGSMFLIGIAGLKFDYFKMPNSKMMIWQPVLMSVVFLSFYLSSQLLLPGGIVKDISLTEVIASLGNYPQRLLYIFLGGISGAVIIYIFHLIPFAVSLVNKDIRVNLFEQQFLMFYLFVGLIGFLGLISWTFMNILKDSVQFFYVPLGIMMGLLLMTVTFLLYKVSKFKWLSLLIILIVITSSLIRLPNSPLLRHAVVTEIYSEDFLKHVDEIIHQNNQFEVVAFFNHEKGLERFWTALPYHNVSVFQSLGGNYKKSVSMNTLEVPIELFEYQERASLKRELANAPLTRFAEGLKEKNQFVSVEETQIEFMRHHHIRYAAVIKGAAYPEALIENAEKMMQDELSGIKFIVLSDAFFTEKKLSDNSSLVSRNSRCQ